MISADDAARQGLQPHAARDATAHGESDRDDRALDRTGGVAELMEPGSSAGQQPARPPAPHAPDDAARARATVGAGSDGRWAWLAPLGTAPIRLTPDNVVVTMSVRWLGGMIVRGRFADVRGMIHVPADDDDTVAVTVEIWADSVRTGISLRDRHLRGPLFLDAARHPAITFRGGDVMRLPTLHRGAGLAHDSRHDARRRSCAARSTAWPRRRELRRTSRCRAGRTALACPDGLRRLDPLFVVIGR